MFLCVLEQGKKQKKFRMEAFEDQDCSTLVENAVLQTMHTNTGPSLKPNDEAKGSCTTCWLVGCNQSAAFLRLITFTNWLFLMCNLPWDDIVSSYSVFFPKVWVSHKHLKEDNGCCNGKSCVTSKLIGLPSIWVCFANLESDFQKKTKKNSPILLHFSFGCRGWCTIVGRPVLWKSIHFSGSVPSGSNLSCLYKGLITAEKRSTWDINEITMIINPLW